MSGVSEARIPNREPFTGAPPAPPAPPTSQPLHLDQHQMRMPYTSDGSGGGAAIYRPVGSSPPPYQTGPPGGPLVRNVGPANLNSGGDQLKKKRGRPRKYGPEGAMGQQQPVVSAPPAQLPSGGAFSPPPQPPPAANAPPSQPQPQPPSAGLESPGSGKKARGRPPGSGKKKQAEALGSTGIGFTPHVLNVNPGEDVSSKIMAFSQNGPRAICVLSANGAISNVTLRQAATSGGTATYEGRFDIISLSGSFMLTEMAGQRSRTGGLSILLSGPDGRVLGGCVAGLLIAGSPVQVIVGSFISDGRKEQKPANVPEPSSVPPKVNPGGVTGGSSSPSRGTFSGGSSGGAASPLNQSTGTCNNYNHQPQGMSGMPW